MRKLKGIPASPGVANGPAYIFQDTELTIEKKTISDTSAELKRFEEATQSALEQIKAIREKAVSETSSEEASIFDAHAMFLQDPTLIDAIRQAIGNNAINAEAAVNEALETHAQTLESMEDEYFRARAADIRDVGRRVVCILLGIDDVDLSSLDQPSIIIARDLTPSDTVRLDKNLVLGFCTVEGGPTSHTAILAKALALPAVVGAGSDVLNVPSSSLILLDGQKGEIVVDPDEALQLEFAERKREHETRSSEELENAFNSAVTLDGFEIEVVANVGNLQDAQMALERGAEGIGLLRTEFLYLDRATAPDEAEQLTAYDQILDLMGERPVIVRTLDVGGDKELPYLDLGQEANPFLGWRAIRMCLDQPDLFKTQLRALLRSSPGHDLRIMFPMIATLEEVRRAKALLDESRDEVCAGGAAVAESIQLGIMVEIPSVVVLADQFAKEVDFFSIGTNDLTQYTMAAERTNEKVAHLGDACHPAVLQQIRSVLQAAQGEGIWVGLCGELAGDPEAIPVLLGLGLDEFSMAPASIPRAKTILRRWSKADAVKLAEEVLDFDSAEDVRDRVRTAQPK
ncbi:MAG: phosphoenolpyruvate--protein phosphotransferase [Anaerolineales bacterium]|nr:MAG: phosphoenolpyruvate--protein phosphotransferase [Anaerolineales bacterium]